MLIARLTAGCVERTFREGEADLPLLLRFQALASDQPQWNLCQAFAALARVGAATLLDLFQWLVGDRREHCLQRLGGVFVLHAHQISRLGHADRQVIGVFRAQLAESLANTAGDRVVFRDRDQQVHQRTLHRRFAQFTDIGNQQHQVQSRCAGGQILRQCQELRHGIIRFRRVECGERILQTLVDLRFESIRLVTVNLVGLVDGGLVIRHLPEDAYGVNGVFQLQELLPRPEAVFDAHVGTVSRVRRVVLVIRDLLDQQVAGILFATNVAV